MNDIICVTGNLGDSAAGLRCILEQINSFDSDVEFLMQRHNRPQVYTYEAQWLAEKSSVHAMIDISDGVASDIRHILKKSNCGCTINLEKLPMSDALVRISKKFNWNSLALAVGGGEDYSLLFTVDANDFLNLKKAYAENFGNNLVPIGIINENKNELAYKLNEQDYILNLKGYDHFNIY